jgi:hypothetical protein
MTEIELEVGRALVLEKIQFDYKEYRFKLGEITTHMVRNRDSTFDYCMKDLDHERSRPNGDE